MLNHSPREVFKNLYPDRLSPRHRLVLGSINLSNGNQSTHPCFNVRQADRLCLTFHHTRRVVFSVGLQSRQAMVAALPALWAVIPFGSEPAPDAAAPPPPGRQEALDLLAAVEQQASIVISTDHAIHALWLLDRLWTFDLDDQSAPDPAGAIDRMQWAVHRLAAGHGWLIPDRGDLAAACPVPGSLTGISDRGPRAVVERFPAAPGDARYRRRDFASLELPPPLEDRPLEDPAPAELATGTEDREVAVAPAAPAPAARPRILITPEQHDVNDRALAALAAARAVFEDAGRLVEVMRAPGAQLAIHPVRAPRLQELLSRHCVFVREPASGGESRAVPPPRWMTAALMARGRWPQLPPLPEDLKPGPRDAKDGMPVGVIDLSAEADLEAGRLLAGLEHILGALGGAATARRIVRTLAAESARFPDLAAACERLMPEIDPAEPGAAAVLGYRLRNLKGRVLDGRVLLESRRTRDGIAWTVRRPPIPQPRKEDATP